MAQDRYGLHVTTSSSATIAALDAYTADWIGYGTGLRGIFEAAENDPTCALANAHAAAVHMALEAASGFAAARPFLKRARAAARDANPREQRFITAVTAWMRGDTRATMNELRRLVDESPADIAAAKWGQYHAFNLGDAEALRWFGHAIMPVHAKTAEAWGMRAFGYEQCHELDLAEEAARRALSLKRSDPWAHHAIAHVMEAQGRVDDGIEFLSSYAHTWADRSIFIREHNYWHLALFHLDRDQPREALAIFDEQLWGPWPEFAQEQIGAISALWRLEMRGVDVGLRWNAVVDHVAARWHEHILPFHDMHFVYALARGGLIGEARAFISSLERHGANDATGVWDGVALPLAGGLLAYAQGKWERAADLIGAQLPQLHRIGGSHAQRDVFVQTWIDAAVKAGQFGAAAVVLAGRHRQRPSVASTRAQLERVKRELLRAAEACPANLQVSA